MTRYQILPEAFQKSRLMCPKKTWVQYLVFSFFCLVSNLVNGTTVAVGLNIAWLVLLSGSKGCFHKCFQVLRTRATSNPE
jgi:hypothetical protein